MDARARNLITMSNLSVHSLGGITSSSFRVLLSWYGDDGRSDLDLYLKCPECNCLVSHKDRICKCCEEIHLTVEKVGDEKSSNLGVEMVDVSSPTGRNNFFEMHTEYYQGRHPGWSSYPKGYPAPNWWSYRSWSRWDHPPLATKTLKNWVGCGSLGTITDEICSKRHCPTSLQWDLFLAGTFVCRWPGGIWGACPTCGISRCSVPVTASCGDRWDGRHFLDERLAIAIQMGAVRIGLRILSSRKGLWMGEVPTWSTWPHMKHMTHAISAANSLVPKMWHKFYEVIFNALKVFTVLIIVASYWFTLMACLRSFSIT